MIPVWFPWTFIGGVVFILLSYVGAKYKDKEYKNIQFLQDFISGAILIAFTGVLVPDVFPAMDLSMAMPQILSGESTDMDLQVGPPRLVGK